MDGWRGYTTALFGVLHRLPRVCDQQCDKKGVHHRHIHDSESQMQIGNGRACQMGRHSPQIPSNVPSSVFGKT